MPTNASADAFWELTATEQIEAKYEFKYSTKQKQNYN